MIVPSSRLLFYTALVALPCSALAAAAPAHGPLAVGLIATLGLVAAGDALLGARRKGAVAVRREQDVFRLNRGEDGQVGALISRTAGSGATVDIALDFPDGFHCRQEILPVHLPEPGQGYRVRWDGRPVHRGRFDLANCHLACPSPLGLWQVQWSAPFDAELRVYPSLRSDRRKVSSLFLNRSDHGLHARPAIGKGREFEQLRDYLPGDPYEDIHWKSTARRGVPVTKIYQVERTQEIYVAIDTSRLSGRPFASLEAPPHEPAPSMLERFLASALLLGVAAEQQGDVFGVLTFDRRVNTFLRASRGTAHYNACRDVLYTQQSSSDSPDFAELCAFIRSKLRKRALVVILTSVADPVSAESLTKGLELIARNHLVMVAMFRPEESAPLFEGEEPADLDSIYAKLAGHVLWSRLSALERELRTRGVCFAQVESGALSAHLISQYIAIKGKQRL